MGRRKKQEAKHDFEEADGGEMLPQLEPEAVAASSSDDEEANEDLSLKIVEKALLKRAAMLAPVPFGGVLSDDDDADFSDGVGAGAGHEAVDLGEAEAFKEEKEEEERYMFVVNKVECQEQLVSSLPLNSKEIIGLYT